MRKSLFFTLVLSLCALDFGANAAVTQRSNARGGNNASAQQTATANTNAQPAAVSARAGNRQKVVNNTAPVSGNVSARAGKKQAVVNSGAKTVSSATTGKPMTARAGSTQKVINTGTKVATATENTMVPQECQDAFYGCMDAFCMLDNVSGGRCQCNDKITELDAVLEDILKLDEQTYVMATEGVERIQMGEAEAEIMARAKAAGEKAASGNSAEENRKKSRTLDLSVFDNNIFSEQDDDVFESQSTQNALLNKKGTALFNETSKLCAAQIPAQCKTYGSMLQLVYAQKIKSDCIAYENSLKAQKNQSQQKLQTAQKALRDAALDEYKNQNRYATVGECVIAFTDCIKTTGECGDDYTGCVTFAAQENLKNDKKGSKAKQTKIKGSKDGADITLAALTMEQLMAKKLICERVTKQCVNANKNDAVWNAFLRNAAPALKSAELIAEQNLRSNCIPTVAKCFTDACKSKFGDNDESYDMCLSNPETYKSLCKVQLEPCLEATGGDYTNPTKSTLWNGLLAMLNAMKVDACTKEVKDCLLSEDRCGADYAGCIGLDTDSIGNLCPDEKLTACMTKYDKGTVKDYVAQVAQGLALQIDNSLATVCQNAANEAMIKACGDAESCPNATLDLGTLASLETVQACKWKGDDTMCLPDISQFTDEEIYVMEYTYNETDKKITLQRVDGADGYGIYATLMDKADVSGITFEQMASDVQQSLAQKPETMTMFVSKTVANKNKGFSQDTTDEVVNVMNGALNRMMEQINNDPKVVYCREGREVKGFNGQDLNKSGKQARFSNLTDNIRNIVANELLMQLYTKNIELENKHAKELEEMNSKITEKIAEIAQRRGVEVEALIDVQNESDCNAYIYEDHHRTKYREWDKTNKKFTETDNSKCGTDTFKKRHLSCRKIKQLTDRIPSYDASTNVCTITTTKYDCTNFRHRIGGGYCDQYDNGTELGTETIQMFKFQ